MTLSEAVRREAIALGFDAVGIARVTAEPQSTGSRGEGAEALFPSFIATLSDRLSNWLARRYHGLMHWMARDPARRADPRQVLPGCQSIICVGLNYYTDQRADEGPGRGRIARYAWGKDYHTVLGMKLRELEKRIHTLAPGEHTRSYVDTGPVMEKAWAQQAGLGWIGKHSNLVSTEFGSWLVLGELLTTLELEPDEPATDLCGSCSLCVTACPTQAITDPYVVDARRCISYLTIELYQPDSSIPDELARHLGNRIFGCDDCLDICPYNVQARPTAEGAFHATPLTRSPSLAELAEMDEVTFAHTFRESPIRRTKHVGLLRNVALARRNEVTLESNSLVALSPRL